MDSTRPVRALKRGLDVLTVLNQRDGASVSEIAQEIRLPRTTAYRILETLCDTKFAFRDAVDDRYRLTARVRRLSGGFNDDRWVTHYAKPLMDELGSELVWPVSLATLSGTTMMLRETTDHHTPLAIERYSAGCRQSILETSVGRAYLAFTSTVHRDSLLDILAEPGSREAWLRTLSDIHLQGYVTLPRQRRAIEEIGLSVPVRVPDRLLAILSVRLASTALPLKTVLERFLPSLRQCASKIGDCYSKQLAEAHNRDAPETAV